MRERAATGGLVARRSRGASDAAACAPARPPGRSRGRRGELWKSSLEMYCCNGRRVAGACVLRAPGVPGSVSSGPVPVRRWPMATLGPAGALGVQCGGRGVSLESHFSDFKKKCEYRM